MTAHPEAVLIEKAARRMVAAFGADPDFEVGGAPTSIWDPHRSQMPPRPGGEVAVRAPRWQFQTREALRILTVVRIANGSVG